MDCPFAEIGSNKIHAIHNFLRVSDQSSFSVFKGAYEGFITACKEVSVPQEAFHFFNEFPHLDDFAKSPFRIWLSVLNLSALFYLL